MKLKVLELVDYARIIHMDSDGLVMKNMGKFFVFYSSIFLLATLRCVLVFLFQIIYSLAHLLK